MVRNLRPGIKRAFGVGTAMSDSDQYNPLELPENGPAMKEEHKIEVTVLSVKTSTLKEWWKQIKQELGWY